MSHGTQATDGKAAGKQRQKQPQTSGGGGGGDAATLPSGAQDASAAHSGVAQPIPVLKPDEARQPASGSAAEGNGSGSGKGVKDSNDVAYPANKSDAAAGSGADSLAGRQDAAVGGAVNSANGTSADSAKQPAAGPSGNKVGKLHVPQHLFAVLGGFVVFALWTLTRRKRFVLFGRRRGSPEPGRRRVAP